MGMRSFHFLDVFPKDRIIFIMQVVFMGTIPDMLPNKICINLKSELTVAFAAFAGSVLRDNIPVD